MHANNHLEFVNPPPPQQYFPTHRLRFETPLKHLKSQVIGQEICINVYTNGMRGSRNFRQWGPGQSDKKALATFFFSPQLILQKSNG